MSHRCFMSPLVLIICILTGFSASAYALEPIIKVPYHLISKKRISRTVFEYTFKATLINGDTAIKQVSATAASNSSFTTVIDGEVSFSDIDANTTTESSDTFIIRQDRLEPFGPESLVWNVSYEPDISTDLEVDEIIDATRIISMRESKKRFLDIDYRFSTKDRSGPTFTLRLNQIIEPATGLVFSQDLNSTVLVDEDSNGIINTDTKQIITAQEPGDYTITTTATVVETGKVVSDVSKVKVFGLDDLYIKFLPIRFGTCVIAINSVKRLNASIGISGEDKNEVSQVILKEIHQGWEFPLQLNGYRHETQIVINTQGVPEETVYEFIAEVITDRGSIQSPIKKLYVSSFPINFAPSKQAKWQGFLGVFGLVAYDQILAEFELGVPEQRIREIVSNIGGEVIGTHVHTGLYQIQLTPAAESVSEIAAKIKALKAYHEVNWATYNTATGSLLYNDPFYKNELQFWPIPIRLDETWYVTQGSSDSADAIAIIDSGVDASHEDLLGKVLQGFDFIDNDTDADYENNWRLDLPVTVSFFRDIHHFLRQMRDFK